MSLFHLIHLVQCNHGSETTQQILNNEELIFQSIPKKETHTFIEIFLQEIKTFREKHKIIDVPYYPIIQFE